MSDTGTDPNTDPEHIRQLRQQADENPVLKTQVQERDREIAFLRAGVSTGTTFGQMVMSKHGADEITEDSVKTVVEQLQTELGIKPAEEPAADPGSDPASPEGQLAAAQAARRAGDPATPEPPAPKPFDDRAMETMHQARRNGMTEQEAQEAGIGEIIRAAANGETGAVYNEDAFKAEAAQVGHGSEFASYPERSYDVIVNETPKANVG